MFIIFSSFYKYIKKNCEKLSSDLFSIFFKENNSKCLKFKKSYLLNKVGDSQFFFNIFTYSLKLYTGMKYEKNLLVRNCTIPLP